MAVEAYQWAAMSQFRNRTVELARLERWWAGPSVEPLSMWGRRRVGKSWLFRRLAHGKPAILLVADRVATGLQLERLGRELEPALGVRPRLDDVGDLFTTLYRLGREAKVLVVVDELPYLLGTSVSEQRANLSTIQAVLEQERDSSQTKLLLAGSTLSTMQDLLAEQNPMHGRLVSFEVRPLGFGHARELMGEHRPAQGALAELTHFAVAGGMPRYLTALRGADLLDDVVGEILDPGGALFNEPRTVLAGEMREPAMYFSILAALAVKPQSASEVANRLRVEARDLSAYLDKLEQLQLVTRYEPVGAKKGARGNTRWRGADDFIRFWFRFVEPYQSELEAGVDPSAYFRTRVEPYLAQHVSLTFEQVFTDWMRRRYEDTAPRTGSWWGSSLHSLRRTKERQTEEIDCVVLDGNRVLALGEAKWTGERMAAGVLRDLDDYKLPALAQAGHTISGAEVVLASKSGFTDELVELATARSGVRLVSAEELVAGLE